MNQSCIIFVPIVGFPLFSLSTWLHTTIHNIIKARIVWGKYPCFLYIFALSGYVPIKHCWKAIHLTVLMHACQFSVSTFMLPSTPHLPRLLSNVSMCESFVCCNETVWQVQDYKRIVKYNAGGSVNSEKSMCEDFLYVDGMKLCCSFFSCIRLCTWHMVQELHGTRAMVQEQEKNFGPPR